MAVRDVLDVAPPKRFDERVREIGKNVAGVLAVEKVRIRKSGTSYFVEIHVQVDGGATVDEGHRIGGQVRRQLRDSTLSIADAFIHIEPFKGSDRPKD